MNAGNMQDGKSPFFAQKMKQLDEMLIPGTGIQDLRPGLIQKARKLACSLIPDHAWSTLDDLSLVRGAGLLGTDPISGLDCLTVAGLLLLGKDYTMQVYLPGRRIEARAQAILGEGNDHQEIFQTNLLSSFEYLMEFVKRNLPDGGFPPEFGGLSLRDAIMREVVSNLIVHRDYGSQVVARLIIQSDRVTSENPCRTRRQGLLDLAWSQASPRNPVIYRFFRKIGYSGESGMGMKVLKRWGAEYFGLEPLVFDRTNFKFFAPSHFELYRGKDLPPKTMQVLKSEPIKTYMASAMQDVLVDSTSESPQENMQDRYSSMQASGPQVSARSEPVSDTGVGVENPAVNSENSKILQKTIPSKLETSENHPESNTMQVDRVQRILDFCGIPRNREEIQKHVGLQNRDYFRKEILIPLLQQGALVATIPDKPNSPKQKYRTAAGVSRPN